MLASISPLGERARGNRWGLTTASYVVASTLAGGALGSVLGGLGGAALGGRPNAVLAAGVALAAGAWDLARPGRIPSLHRQVDEDWLVRYRGWVYGAGFGLQLGLGVVTIITSATVYAWMIAAGASASAVIGGVAGVCFGASRSLPLVLTRRAVDARALRRHLRAMASAAGRAHRGAAIGSVAVGLGAMAGVVGSGR